jgi:hypothetical protein
MMLLGGIQLLFIGVLGEYIARIYNETKGRPKYIVARQFDQQNPPLAYEMQANDASLISVLKPESKIAAHDD